MQDINGYLERATLLLNQGRPDDAATWAKKALASEPENADALALLARVHLDRKETDQANQLLQQAIAIDPQRSFFYYLLAFAHYHQDVEASALEYIHKAISMDPYVAEYYGLEAYIHIGAKRFREALDKANEGLSTDAENITCLNARSTAQNKLKMTDDAVATMQDALSKDPDNEFTHATVGWNYLEKGHIRESTHHFREALRIDPNMSAAQEGLKESLKSKIPPYRWLLQFGFWLNNKGKDMRWILIAIFVIVRLVVIATKDNENTEMIAIAVGGAYVLVVALSWLMNPIANCFLLFHRDGKYALTKREKTNAYAFMGTIFMAGLLLALSLLIDREGDDGLMISALIVFSFSIPAGHMEFPLRLRNNSLSQWLAMALGLFALTAMLLALAGIPDPVFVYVCYAILFIVYTWVTSLS